MSCKSENKTETTPNNAVGYFQNPIKTSYDLKGHPNPTKIEFAIMKVIILN